MQNQSIGPNFPDPRDSSSPKARGPKGAADPGLSELRGVKPCGSDGEFSRGANPLFALVAEKCRLKPLELTRLDPVLHRHFEDLQTLCDRIVRGDTPVDDWDDLADILHFAGQQSVGSQERFVATFFELARCAPTHDDLVNVLESAAICAEQSKPAPERLSEFAKAARRILSPFGDNRTALPGEAPHDAVESAQGSTPDAGIDQANDARTVALSLYLGIIHHAVKRNWSNHSLSRLLSVIPETTSIKGNLARLSALDEEKEGFNKNGIRADFNWISTWEHDPTNPDSAVERGRNGILKSALRHRFVAALSAQEEQGVSDLVYSLIATGADEGLASERAVLALLGARPEEAVLRDVAHLSALGLSLHVAARTDDDSLVSRRRGANAQLAALTQDPAILDDVIQGLALLRERIAARRPDSPPSEHLIPKLFGELFDPSDSRRIEALVVNRVSREKLLLCLRGSGVDSSEAISTHKDFNDLITQIHAQFEMDRMLAETSGTQAEALREQFARRFRIDNPPFSLQSVSRDERVQFMRMTERVLRRQIDGYLGFWANTFVFRHTPVSQRCQFDEFAAGVGKRLWVVPSDDIWRFPGRGRVLEGLELTRVFAPSPHASSDDPLRYWKDQVFAEFGPIPSARSKGNVHALDNLADMRITALRGAFAFTNVRNRFFCIDDEPMTYIDFNHHFDPTGAHRGFLVPTRAFDALLRARLIPYSPHTDAFPFKSEKGQEEFHFSVQRMREAARQLGCRIGVVNLSSGSTYGGGLCNGLDPESAPYFDWQRTKNQYKDGFGHPHKWNVQSQAHLLSRMHGVSRRIYEVSTAYQNARDLYKIAFAIDAKGWSQRRAVTAHGAPSGESPQQGTFELDREPGRRPRATPLRRDGESFERVIDEEKVRERDQARGRYLLDLFCDFVDESLDIGLPKEQFPVLVISNMLEWATAPETPILLHGRLGFAFRAQGKPVEFLDGRVRVNRERLSDLWDSEVAPYLANPEHYWKAPRIVAQQNYVGHVKRMMR